jgi:glycosyltransferase involved in cell wall biosynthesis
MPSNRRHPCVLHIVPESVENPQHLYLGTTKDIRGRTEYFQTRDIPFDELVVKKQKRNDRDLVRQLSKMSLDRYTAAIFEMPRYPASLRFLRLNFPHIRLITRSVNAEFYHRLHQCGATALNPVGMPTAKVANKSFLYLRSSLTRLRLDYLCAKWSHYVLSITEWEKENYWQRLTDASKIRNLPYFLPDSYREDHRFVAKKDKCVCLMSTVTRDAGQSFNLDAAKKFAQLVDKLEHNCPEWCFFITGEILDRQIRMPERVVHLGFLDSPFGILAESRALALLSDYGFGFKTKVLDAISHHCYVLVTKKLYSRLPMEVQPYCIIVDPQSVQSLSDALEMCKQPYPEGNPNDIFRDHAYEVLDELICDAGLTQELRTECRQPELVETSRA